MFYFAVLKIGGIIVNFNPLYVERELSFQARDAGVRTMVTLDLKVIYDKVEAVRREGSLDTIIVCPMAEILPQPKKLLFTLFKRKERADIPRDAAHPRYDDIARGGARPTPVEIDPETDIAVFQYTGGTTGVPKGAMLTHANLSANLEQLRTLFADARHNGPRYLHLLDRYVRTGDEVGRGQPLGRCGSTGRSTSPHLHFEVLVDGEAEPPLWPWPTAPDDMEPLLTEARATVVGRSMERVDRVWWNRFAFEGEVPGPWRRGLEGRGGSEGRFRKCGSASSQGRRLGVDCCRF